MFTQRAKTSSYRADRTVGTFTRVANALRIQRARIQGDCCMWNLPGGDS